MSCPYSNQQQQQQQQASRQSFYARYSNNSNNQYAYSNSSPQVSTSQQAYQAISRSQSAAPRSNLLDTILNSSNPVQINETAQISASGHHGIHANRSEDSQWQGQVPLSQYQLNEDSNPEVIRKKPSQGLKYRQEIAVRYLNPPPAPKPGDLIIRQAPGRQMPPAPPLIVREQNCQAASPPPLVYREAPPRAPSVFESKVVRIEGKSMPPPPRRVVIEKYPDEPQKPAPIIIERWLPYKPRKVKVIFQKAPAPCPCQTCCQQQQQQQVVQYQPAPSQQQQQVVQYQPAPSQQQQQQQPSQSVVQAQSVQQFRAPTQQQQVPVVAARASSNNNYPAPELEGDAEALAALKRVNLKEHGLEQYARYLH